MKQTPWTIDKTVNLPFLITVASAVVAAAMWATKTDNQLTDLQNATAAIPAMSAKLERLDERSEAMRRDIDGIASSQRRSEANQ